MSEERPHRTHHWKAWVFEFFLIFFSVSLSYLVDNYRQYLADQRQASTYAADMITDMEKDTATLRNRLAVTRQVAENVDTFLSLISHKGGSDVATGALYWYGLFCGYPQEFAPDDATFGAMTSSGDLHLFDYRRVGRYVAQYYERTTSITRNDAVDDPIYAEVRGLHAKIFEFSYNSRANDIVQANRVKFSQARIDSFVRLRPPLLSRDPALMSEYGELCRSRFFGVQVALYAAALAAADTAIARLQLVGR